jgi:hypothetical protein
MTLLAEGGAGSTAVVAARRGTQRAGDGDRRTRNTTQVETGLRLRQQ